MQIIPQPINFTLDAENTHYKLSHSFYNIYRTVLNFEFLSPKHLNTNNLPKISRLTVYFEILRRKYKEYW